MVGENKWDFMCLVISDRDRKKQFVSNYLDVKGDNQIRISPTTDNYLRILGRQIQSESVAPAAREKDNLQTPTIFHNG